ncbi:MAG: 16S rRNA (cytosine(967)-C(5))-methyltransferase RsmB [Limnochordia bacterium]|jgi:16S rRNA (cytosine967-C5)-methyltransferase|nr:16S rRNA (cytosine(967)-C(5))-methyltransferase RsmB [Limnochordia bacterium]MDD4517313.1 16S rRNA (cytosine(967)-C(5))-methyltransferase RsmB [Limnochordia bacterium]
MGKGPSTNVSPARQVALAVLMEVEGKRAYATLALNEKLPGLTKKDRALATEIVCGTLRNRSLLDWHIRQVADRPLETMSPPVRNILRLSTYQILFLDSIGDYAIVDEAVRLTKSSSRKAAGFVNGVLRNLLRKLPGFSLPCLADDPVAYVSIKYSHPAWLVERWIANFGIQHTIAYCQANNETPPTVIRTNTLKISREELFTSLGKAGINGWFTEYVPESIVVEKTGSPEALPGYHEGWFFIQDESSMIAAHCMDPKPTDVVYDLCSAPGGKATHLAQLMGNHGEILAVDIHEHRLKLIEENARRLGITNIETVLSPAEKLPEEFFGKAQRVLVDAPCSGLGVLRRRVDARWHKSEADIVDLQQIQRSILSRAASLVAPGGILVYTTCTLEPEETLDNVAWFLSSFPDYFPGGTLSSRFSRFAPSRLYRVLSIQREVQRCIAALAPHLDGTDGFFIAQFEKKQ